MSSFTEKLRTFLRSVEMKKVLGGGSVLGVYQKGKWFDPILVGNSKPEIWYVSTQTGLISDNIPFSTRTSLILLRSADHASGVRILNCSKFTMNLKMAMTSLYIDETSPSIFLTLLCSSCQV